MWGCPNGTQPLTPSSPNLLVPVPGYWTSRQAPVRRPRTPLVPAMSRPHPLSNAWIASSSHRYPRIRVGVDRTQHRPRWQCGRIHTPRWQPRRPNPLREAQHSSSTPCCATSLSHASRPSSPWLSSPSSTTLIPARHASASNSVLPTQWKDSLSELAAWPASASKRSASASLLRCTLSAPRLARPCALRFVLRTQ